MSQKSNRKRGGDLTTSFFCLGTTCPEVSACDEAPQSKVEIVQLIHQPLRDGRDAMRRDQKRKDKEHDPAQRLAADEQGHGKQGQQHTGHNETAVAIQDRNETTAARTASTTTKGAARIFRTIISGYLL